MHAYNTLPGTYACVLPRSAQLPYAPCQQGGDSRRCQPQWWQPAQCSTAQLGTAQQSAALTQVAVGQVVVAEGEDWGILEPGAGAHDICQPAQQQPAQQAAASEGVVNALALWSLCAVCQPAPRF